MFPKIEFYLVWTIALLAMAGSLFFSDVLKVPPCDLCWYQRIFTYPLVFMMPLAIFRQDVHVRVYVTALLIPGMFIAAYHNLLYYSFIEKELVPCTGGVSCSDRGFELFGFVGIPLMSLLSFIAMLSLIAFTYRKRIK